MSQDLKEYQNIIEQLKPMVNEPELNQVLTQVAGHLPRPKRFLIKMELKRLARPCIRLIDLRGNVDGECRLYEYEGKQHYLDEIAIEVFERQVRSFGEYTMGVYEAVTNTENNFRVMQQKQKQEENETVEVQEALQQEQPSNKLHARFLKFGDFATRQEERMNYAMQVEVFKAENKSMQATSIDISINGLKLKIGKEHIFKTGEELNVHFRGLEGEYTLDKKVGIPFEIRSVERSENDMRLGLQRVKDNPNPTFDAFIERFIHGNKRRYKVNMSNTLDAIRNKSFEQYYTPNFTSIPVYIEQIDNSYSAKYVLANDCNREAIYYWLDEQNILRLGYLFTDRRIRNLIDKPAESRDTFLYVFNHVKDDKVYFYSATQEELTNNPSLRSVFLGYGARKASWRVYKLALSEMQPDQAYLPLSIPDAVSTKVKKQNQPPPPRLMARLKNLAYLCFLTDITEAVATNQYQKYKLSKKLLPELRVFGHPRNKLPPNVDMFRFKYQNQRRETRFQLRSRVNVNYNGMTFDGTTEDISVRGVKIELTTFFHDETDVIVHLSFPKLQKITSKYQLIDLPYKVRSISRDGNVLHLQAISNENNRVAQYFFEELIRYNRNRLVAYKDEEEIPGMGEALRNICARNITNIAFVVKKHGTELLPSACATAIPHTRLYNLLMHNAEPGHLNLRLLFDENIVVHTIKTIKTSNRPFMHELFIGFSPSKIKYEDAIKTAVSDKLKTEQQRKAFIENALHHGQFIAIKVFIARAGRPDTEFLNTELAYVGSFAMHRAKILEDNLWNIVGVGDIVDVTDEVLSRFGFDEKAIQSNHKKPASSNANVEEIGKLLTS